MSRPWDEMLPGRKRRSITDIIMERMRKPFENTGTPGNLLAVPENPLGPRQPIPPSSPDFMGPDEPSPLQRMISDRAKLEAPPTRKQAVLGGLLQAAPIAIGGLFGGSEGAYGAGQGVESAIKESTRQREARGKTLSDEIQQARQQEFQGEQAGLGRELQQRQLESTEAGRQATLGQQQAQLAQQATLAREGHASAEKIAGMKTDQSITPYEDFRKTGKPIEDWIKMNQQPRTDTSISPFEAWQKQNPNAPVLDFIKGSQPPRQDMSVTPFEVWQRQNPGKPVDEFLKLQNPRLSTEPSPYSKERAVRTVQSVDELMGKVNAWTTGYGSLFKNWPGSAALNFRAELDTLKSNIAFNELTAMREASKTGGALGNVSDRETALLSSALGALDQAQSAADVRAQLAKVKASVERWQQATAANKGNGGAQYGPPEPRTLKDGRKVTVHKNLTTGKYEDVD